MDRRSSSNQAAPKPKVTKFNARVSILQASYRLFDIPIYYEHGDDIANAAEYERLIKSVNDLEDKFETICVAFNKKYFNIASNTSNVFNAATLWKRYLREKHAALGELLIARRALFAKSLFENLIENKNSMDWKEATILNNVAIDIESPPTSPPKVYEKFKTWKSALAKIPLNSAVQLWNHRAIIDYNQLADAANIILGPSSKVSIKLKKKPDVENNSLARTSFRQSANMGDSVVLENANGEVVGVRLSQGNDAPIVPPARGWFGAAYDTVANATGRTAAFLTGKPAAIAAGTIGALGAAGYAGSQAFLSAAAPVAAPLYQPVVNFAAPLASQAAGYAGQALGYAAPYYDQALGYVAPIASQAGTYLAEIDPTTAAIVGTASLAAIGGMVALKNKFMTKAEEKKAIETLERATNKLEQRGSRVSERASQKTGSAAVAESFALAENSIESAATNARVAIENAKRVTGDRKSQAIAVAAAAVLDLGAKVSRTSRAADRIPIAVIGQPQVTFLPEQQIIPPVILPFADLPNPNAKKFRTSRKPSGASPARRRNSKTITSTVRGKPVGKRTPAKRPSRAGTRSVSPKRAATKKSPVKRRATTSPVKRGRSPNKSSATKKKAAPRSVSPRGRPRARR
jgi:hypothetical protein